MDLDCVLVGQIFPYFTPPAGATADEITLVKSTLYADFEARSESADE